MQIRRCAIGGLTILASLAFTTAGCGLLPGRSDRAEPSATPASPKEVLANSVTELTRTSHKFTMKDAESTGEGAVDPQAQKANMDLVFADVEAGLEMTLNLLVIGEDAWLKLDFGRAAGMGGLPKLPKQWMHLDKTKIQDAEELELDDEDPVGAAEVFEAIVTVEPAGDRLYKGTADLTKATGAALVNDDHVKALGDKAKAIPFEATVDDKGRLVSLELDVPAAGEDKAQSWEATYLDYGVPITLDKPPASEVVEAPAEAYKIFNT